MIDDEANQSKAIEAAMPEFVDSFNGDEAGDIDQVFSVLGDTGWAMRGGNDVRAVLGKAYDALAVGLLSSPTPTEALWEKKADGRIGPSTKGEQVWSTPTEPSDEHFSSGKHLRVNLQGSDVCDTCINSLGLNVRWDHAIKRQEHTPTEPSDDEKNVVYNIVHEAIKASDLTIDLSLRDRYSIALAVTAALFAGRAVRDETGENVESIINEVLGRRDEAVITRDLLRSLLLSRVVDGETP